VRTSGSNLQVLLEGLRGSRRRNRLVTLQGGFTEQVDTLLVVGLGPCRVGSDGLVERGIGVVHTACVGVNGTDVEVCRAGLGRVNFCRRLVTLNRIVDLLALGIRVGHIDVEPGKLLVRLGGVFLFAVLHCILLELDCFLIGVDRRFVTLLPLCLIRLRHGRQAISITEAIPKNVAGRVDLIGFGERGDRGIVVLRSNGLIGRVKLSLQIFDSIGFFLLLRLLLLHGLQLLRGEAFPFCLLLLLFLLIEVQYIFIELNRKALYEVHGFVGLQVIGSFVQRDVVLARGESEREILTLLVRLQLVFLTVILIGKNNDRVGDGIALGILACSLHCS